MSTNQKNLPDESRQLIFPQLLNTKPLCACGCNLPVNSRGRKGLWRNYRRGHKLTPPPTNIPLCACGCNQLTIWDNRIKAFRKYLKWHCWNDPEYRKLQRAKTQEQWLNPEFRKKITSIQSETLKKLWTDPEFRKGQIDRLNILWSKPEYQEMQRLKTQRESKARWLNPDYRNQMSERMSKQTKKYWENPENRNRKSIESGLQMKKLWTDPEFRARQIIIQSERMKKRWANPESRQALVDVLMNKKPNKPESLINAFTPFNVRYIGNGIWWRTLKIVDIDGNTDIIYKNPDFKVKGQNKLIEVFGDYWHKDDDPEYWYKVWKDNGYELLVIWEHEIKNDLEKVLIKIANFINQDQWQYSLMGI